MDDPGWYPDLADVRLLRYWDGAEWTSQTRPRPVDDLPAPGAWVAPWGGTVESTPRPATAPHAPPVATRPRPRWLTPAITALTVALLGGATFGGWKVYDAATGDVDYGATGAIVSAGDGDGTAPLTDVTAPLGHHGIACNAGGEALTHGQLVDFAGGLRRSFAASDADTARAQAADELVAAVADLDEADTFSTSRCGTSFLVVSGADVRFAFFEGAAPDAVADVADLGVRLVSVAPPTVDAATRLIERRGDTCDRSSSTTTRAALATDVSNRLRAGGASDGLVAFGATAVQQLPDATLSVHTCTTAQLVGAGDSVQLIVLATSAAPIAERFTDDHAVVVVGP